MARDCTICSHPRRSEIETAMVHDHSSRRIAADYGLAYGAIHRHRNNHLPAAIRQAAEAALDDAAWAETAPQVQTPTTPAHGLPEAAPAVAPTIAPETAPTPVRTRQRTRALQLTDSPPAPLVSPAPAGHGAPAATSIAPTAGTFNLYQSATDLRERAMAILAAAERDRDAKTALMAIREARGVLDHMSRLEERQGAAGPTVALADSADWHRTRAAIITALADHPEARLAVAEALISTGAM